MPQTARHIPLPHPYIVCTEGVCGGRVHIRDTRIPVSAVAELLRQGEPAEEIMATFGKVAPAAIDDAIGYCLEHRQEMDAELAEESLESALENAGAVLGEDGVIRFRNRPK
jgi:uncharacterized protein (DUF433 family)